MKEQKETNLKTKKNYEALARDLEKHKELVAEDHDLRCLELIENKIFTCELIEDYGWSIPSHITGNGNWFRISDEISAGTFGGDTKRTISWEDNNLDAKGEFLLRVSFCTGAYFFGQYYDNEFFREFFLELNEYGPSFKDSRNKALYFSKEKAGKLLQDYTGLVGKYRKRYKSEADKRKAKKLREELQKLEGV